MRNEELIKNSGYFDEVVGMRTHITHDQDEYIHCHEYYEIFYVLSGDITHMCNGVRDKISTGDIFLMKPNDFHGFIREGECSHRDIMIRSDLMLSVMKFFSIDDGENFIERRFPLKGKLSPNAMETMENMLDYYSLIYTKDVYAGLNTAKTILSFLFGQLIVNGGEKQENSAYPDLLRRMLNHLAGPGILSGEQTFDKLFNYSRIYLSRYFKKHMGITITEFTNNIRVERAVLLLRSTNLSVSEISNRIGLESVSYFHKIFKKRFGQSPLQYRNQFKNPK